MKTLAMGLVLLGMTAAQTAWAGNPFDGAWIVMQNRTPAAEDLRGYAWTYPATVRSDFLSGQHSPPDRETARAGCTVRPITICI